MSLHHGLIMSPSSWMAQNKRVYNAGPNRRTNLRHTRNNRFTEPDTDLYVVPLDRKQIMYTPEFLKYKGHHWGFEVIIQKTHGLNSKKRKKVYIQIHTGPQTSPNVSKVPSPSAQRLFSVEFFQARRQWVSVTVKIKSSEMWRHIATFPQSNAENH